MIKEKIFYIVECDKCKKMLGNPDEYEILLFKTKKEAIDAINNGLKNWKIKGKKIYCDVCEEVKHE
jgi:hypothetical protein